MKKRLPPARPSPTGFNQPRGILELDRFNSESLARWGTLSRGLNELQDVLYFGLEPERRRLRSELVQALENQPPLQMELANWARIVTFQFSNEPLSCAGSLQDIGGRFNAGAELDPNTLNPWPALYLADNYETAFREKFQIEHTGTVDGLSPEELALEHGVSHTTVFLQGHLSRIIDLSQPNTLNDIARVFGRIKMPERGRKLKSELRIPSHALAMTKTGKQILNMVVNHNWRVLPIQFGLPSQSHILADLVRVAGFEGILYQSTKGPGMCLAVFPETLENGSFIELRDTAPTTVKYTRLDADSAEALAGWDSLPSRFRSR